MNENTNRIKLTGLVTSGEGEAKNFISIPGYMGQFEEKLGYAPYPGTLNVLLDEASIPRRLVLDTREQITIDGWEQDGQSFGAVYCLPVEMTVMATKATHETVHAIYPDRTKHEPDTLELIAPIGLRERYGLSDGERVTVQTE